VADRLGNVSRRARCQPLSMESVRHQKTSGRNTESICLAFTLDLQCNRSGILRGISEPTKDYTGENCRRAIANGKDAERSVKGLPKQT
jgi:hypothetical protein